MKTLKTGRLGIAGVCLIAICSFLIVSGCSDDPSEPVVEVTPITVDEIIINPKAPQPRDTVFLSAVITSSSQNVGEIPSYSWEADGGEFLEATGSFVRWLAPENPRLYTVKVTATNSVSTSAKNQVVFIADIRTRIISGAGEIHPVTGQNAFYYLHSSFEPTSLSYEGFNLNKYESGSSDTLNADNPGSEFVISSNQTKAAHSHTEDAGGVIVLIPAMNIYIDDLASGTQMAATVDEADPINRRKHQNTQPVFSPDISLVAYQAFRTSGLSPEQGGIDTFDVYVYEVQSMARHRITTSAKNFYPSFSSDGAYLTFISDKDTLSEGWELFSFPVSGGVVDTTEASRIQLTHTGGFIAGTTAEGTPKKPLYSWNPNSSHPVLALKAADNRLRFIRTDGSVTVVQGIPGSPEEMVWSHDGSILAVASGSSLYGVGVNSGVAEIILTAIEDDVINDISWSPDNSLIIYSIERFASVWYELVDLSGALDLSEPLRITKEFPSSVAEDYREEMSIRPAWKSDVEIYFLLFESSTPSVKELSIAGLFLDHTQ